MLSRTLLVVLVAACSAQTLNAWPWDRKTTTTTTTPAPAVMSREKFLARLSQGTETVTAEVAKSHQLVEEADAADKFMIYCDGCETWFHDSCAGETQESVANTEHWYCRCCRASNKKYDVLSQRVSKLEEEFGSRNIELDNSFQKVVDLQRNLKDVSLERDSLHVECQCLKANISQKQQDFDNFKFSSSTQVDTLKKELQNVSLERDTLRVECQSLKEKLSQLQLNFDTFKISVTSSSEVAILKKDLHDMSSERNGLLIKCQVLAENVSQVQQDFDNFKLKASTEVAALKKELCDVSANHRRAMKENIELMEAAKKKRKLRLSLSQQLKEKGQ